MRIIKVVTLMIAAAVSAAGLTGCASPSTQGEVISSLESAMRIGFRHISTEYSKSQDGHEKSTHYFEDENGVCFKVLSSVYDSPLGPSGGSPVCDYACVLFDRQKDVVMSAVQSDLQTDWIESTDRDGISLWNGIEIRVSCYSDLEKAAQLVENALLSIEPFPFYPGPGQYDCKFYLPTIKVISANGRTIHRNDFRTEMEIQHPKPEEGSDDTAAHLQKSYLDMMRLGMIKKEELPHAVWERFPATYIHTIYLNDERFEDIHGYVLDPSMGGYRIGTNDIFSDNGIFTRYVKQMHGEYTVDGDIKTWTVNGDIWRATMHSNANRKKDSASSRPYLEITKNGETQQIPNWLTFEEFGDFIGFEINIDQEEPAIHIVTPLQ